MQHSEGNTYPFRDFCDSDLPATAGGQTDRDVTCVFDVNRNTSILACLNSTSGRLAKMDIEFLISKVSETAPLWDKKSKLHPVCIIVQVCFSVYTSSVYTHKCIPPLYTHPCILIHVYIICVYSSMYTSSVYTHPCIHHPCIFINILKTSRVHF